MMAKANHPNLENDFRIAPAWTGPSCRRSWGASIAKSAALLGASSLFSRAGLARPNTNIGSTTAENVTEGGTERVGTLRFLKVRHATFLLEMEGVRVLFDPWFSREPLSELALTAPEPAPSLQNLGRIDVLMLTSTSWDRFDPFSLRALASRESYCFVPDERCARTLRSAGFTRVRVTKAGDQWRLFKLKNKLSSGLKIDVSMADGGVGYRLEHLGRTLWNTGPLLPLDVEKAPISWVRHRPAEVVLTGWDRGLGARLGNAIGPADAVFLAQLARARFVVPQGNEVLPAGAVKLALSWAGALTGLGGAGLGDEHAPVAPPGGPRVIKAERGLWYRVARPESARTGSRSSTVLD